MRKITWRKALVSAVILIIGLFTMLLVALYYYQEKLLFHPEVLAKNHTFTFAGDFDEVYIPLEEDVKLHGVLFKAEKPKGLVFYLHGNGGSVNGWGNIADTFVNAGYDLFILDYRGYGKSTGVISSEEQLHNDIQKAYTYMLKEYEEADVIIAGYSIGTGLAARLAQGRNIKALILQAPYYSMSSLVSEKAPQLPGFINRYKLNTYKFIENVTAYVYIFHGTEDQLIDYSHSQRLLKHAKPSDTLISIKGGHNMMHSDELKEEISKMLES